MPPQRAVPAGAAPALSLGSRHREVVARAAVSVCRRGRDGALPPCCGAFIISAAGRALGRAGAAQEQWWHCWWELNRGQQTAPVCSCPDSGWDSLLFPGVGSELCLD